MKALIEIDFEEIAGLRIGSYQVYLEVKNILADIKEWRDKKAALTWVKREEKVSGCSYRIYFIENKLSATAAGAAPDPAAVDQQKDNSI